jgi:hypothetical protein
MREGGPALVVLLTLVLSCSTASAGTGFSAQVEGQLTVHGFARGQLALAMAQLDETREQVWQLDESQLLVVRETHWELRGNITPVGPSVDFDELPLPSEPRVERDEVLRGTLRFSPGHGVNTMRLLSAAPAGVLLVPLREISN